MLAQTPDKMAVVYGGASQCGGRHTALSQEGVNFREECFALVHVANLMGIVPQSQWEVSLLPRLNSVWENTHMAIQLPSRVAALMAAQGINQKRLAQVAGLNETYVRDVLTGRSKNPRHQHLAKLAEALGTTIDQLTSSDDHPTTTGTVHKMSNAAKRTARAERQAFATRLQALRQTYGIRTGRQLLSKEEFAAMLGLEGETYRRYERAETEPSLRVLTRIREVTGVSLNSLIAGEIDRAA